MMILERNFNSADCLLSNRLSILVEGWQTSRDEGLLLVNSVAEQILP